MNEMVNHPYLGRRGKSGRFVYRRRVPDRLRPIIGKQEIVKALGTHDRLEALEAYRRVDDETARNFANAASMASGKFGSKNDDLGTGAELVARTAIDLDDVLKSHLEALLDSERHFRREQSKYLHDHSGSFRNMPLGNSPEYLDWLYNGSRSSGVLPDEQGQLAKALTRLSHRVARRHRPGRSPAARRTAKSVWDHTFERFDAADGPPWATLRAGPNG